MGDGGGGAVRGLATLHKEGVGGPTTGAGVLVGTPGVGAPLHPRVIGKAIARGDPVGSVIPGGVIGLGVPKSGVMNGLIGAKCT